MMKLCKDRDCLRFGIALNLSEFPRNARMRDGKHIYCRQCCCRRSQEYRLNMINLIARTQVKIPVTGFRIRVRT